MVDERGAWAVLSSVGGLGPATFGRLLREQGSATRVLELAASASGQTLLRNGPSGSPGERGADDDPVAAADRRRIPIAVIAAMVLAARTASDTLGRWREAGISFVTLDDPAYPSRLRAIDEPPVVLFVRGSLDALSAPHAVAVVGTRRPTEAGRQIATRIGDALTRSGAVVVSGLAVGIDGAAHAAAVAVGMPTVAVLGSGHDRLFPRAHVPLADAIVAAGGAVVSELSPDALPTQGTFPRRNRVISGLTQATIVIEAAARSGALITAGWALEQGRGCFLVPGSIDAPASAGCLAFLRAFPGEARIVAGIPELVEDLDLVDRAHGMSTGSVGPGGPPRATMPAVSLAALQATLGAVEARLAGLLVAGLSTVDELAEGLDLPAATVLGAITLLELRGLISSAYGRYRPAGALTGCRPGLPHPRSGATLTGDRPRDTRVDQTAARSR